MFVTCAVQVPAVGIKLDVDGLPGCMCASWRFLKLAVTQTSSKRHDLYQSWRC